MRTGLLIVFLLSFSVALAQGEKADYWDTNLTFEKRAEDLVSRMTLEEKITQMIHNAPAIKRLGIPAYNWMNECLHGVANMEDFVTVFPQSIGMGASWDRDCLFRVGTAISDEARAMHHNGYLNKEGRYVGGLTFWSPNINLFRDPRWGRGQESYGEDPFHLGQMGIQFIKGLQGDHHKYLKVVSTAKHYVVHSGPEPERHRFDAVTNKRDFWESYMPHFIDAIEEADVYSIMCAYNRTNGESCCGSRYLLNELLRERFGFEGYVVSDCGSVTDIFEEEGHRLVETPAEAAALAVKTGVDLNCGRGTYFPYRNLSLAVRQGLITEEEIDVAVTRLMLARMKLGMFDAPERVPYSKIAESVIDCPAHQDLALEMARKSMVLLKNENSVLPLSKSIKKIAVVGPNASNEMVLLGNYHGTPSNPVSVLTGIKEKLSRAKVGYSQGCDYVNSPDLMTALPSYMLYTNQAMEKKGIHVQYFNNKSFSGKAIIETTDRHIFLTSEFGPPYATLKENNFSVRWSGCLVVPESARYNLLAEGPENCRIWLDGKSLIDLKQSESSDFIRLEAGKPYRLQIDLVAESDEFDLMLYIKNHSKDLVSNALAAAEEADAVVLAMGISNEIEGEELGVDLPGFQGGDRTAIELPEVQTNLIRKIKKLNKPTVLVLMGGGAFAVPEEHELCDAVVQAWYPGQSGGSAIADVLFGDVNPAGRLPVTFYKKTSDMPGFRNYDMAGRTYRFFEGEPLYAFGFGLSYTTFEYSDLDVPDEIGMDEAFQASVTVTNTGSMDGDEVVQLYVKDLEASVRVPKQSLQGFERLHLKAGESERVTFSLSQKNLAILNEKNQWVIEPGEFLISIGGGQPEYSKSCLTRHTRVTGDN